MKKLALLILFGLMALGLEDMIKRSLYPEPAPTVTAWAKLKELFH